MFCKFCNTEMEDDRLYCPECGKRQDQELKKEPESKKKEKEKKEKKSLSGLVMTVGVVPMVISAVALIVVIVLLVMIIIKDSKATPQVPPQTTVAPQPETTVTVTPEEYVAAKETVVSALADDKLTNGLLQMFYTTEINRFIQEYGSSISQFGLDPTKPLSDQPYPYEEAETWEEFFAELALEQWRNCVGLLMLAESEQFAFDPAIQEEMNSLPLQKHLTAVAVIFWNFWTSL